jgi:hypothetical protein
VILAGRIIDSGTGAGIAGANVWVLAPDTNLDEVKQSDVVTWAIADGQGVFRMAQPVAAGAAYPLIVSAAGYQRLLGTASLIRALSRTAVRPGDTYDLGTVSMQRQ